MSTQTEKAKDNPLVKLVKKSVGLPTGESGCCGTVAQDKEIGSCCDEQPSAAREEADSSCAATESGCCGSVAQGKEISSCCDEQPSPTAETTGCGCGATESS